MWGGIYALLFSMTASIENPIKMVFQRVQLIFLVQCDFRTKLLAKKFNIRFLKIRFGPLQRGQSISVTDEGGLWINGYQES